MDCNNEIIILNFPLEEENLTWKKRTSCNSCVEANDLKSDIKEIQICPDIKASVKVECAYCKEMIENSENIGYRKHLQFSHSVEFEKICKQKAQESILSEKEHSIKNNEGFSFTSSKESSELKEMTSRGLELQKRLSELQKETKRKDLNSIEKEYLSNELIELKKEMIVQIEKFSKQDCIPVRLDQIERYLARLNMDKTQPKMQVETIISKNNDEEKKDSSKKGKRKMQVVYKFGL